ncbi:MAG: nitroreductase family protein [Acidobacteriota bacterium]
MSPERFRPLEFQRFSAAEMQERAQEIYRRLSRRRSVRDFSPEPVPARLVELAVRTAATAPSGAHCQPWHFVLVGDPDVKRRIREAAEKVEREAYEQRMPPEWLQELEPLGTSWRKPYLETAPWLVVVFAQSYRLGAGGEKRKNYYVQESVGIACGLFIAAIHHMGLATLPHTPSPMGFLGELLGRPPNERPYVLFPVGFPAEGAQVPDLTRKPFDEVATWVRAPE